MIEKSCKTDRVRDENVSPKLCVVTKQLMLCRIVDSMFRIKGLGIGKYFSAILTLENINIPSDQQIFNDKFM